jgi:hypothetical protein
MVRYTRGLVVAMLVAGCGGESAKSDQTPGSGGSAAVNDEDFDACSLLTTDEIQSAAGWAPDTSKSDTYGTTKVCSYSGPEMKQSIAIVVARPAPKVSSSAELAERRNQALAKEPSIKMTITPIEDLGMPAVRSQVEGSEDPTVEVVVGRHLLGVSAGSFEASKALAAKAAGKMK